MPSVAMMIRVRKDLPKYPARNEIINETLSHTDTAADRATLTQMQTEPVWGLKLLVHEALSYSVCCSQRSRQKEFCHIFFYPLHPQKLHLGQCLFFYLRTYETRAIKEAVSCVCVLGRGESSLCVSLCLWPLSRSLRGGRASHDPPKFSGSIFAKSCVQITANVPVTSSKICLEK